jgi:hypothetical protein
MWKEKGKERWKILGKQKCIFSFKKNLLLVASITVLPTLTRQRQKDCEFNTNLGYIVRLCLKIVNKRKEKERSKHKEVLIE